jgi:hypothetical protein
MLGVSSAPGRRSTIVERPRIWHRQQQRPYWADSSLEQYTAKRQLCEDLCCVHVKVSLTHAPSCFNCARMALRSIGADKTEEKKKTQSSEANLTEKPFILAAATRKDFGQFRLYTNLLLPVP